MPMDGNIRGHASLEKNIFGLWSFFRHCDIITMSHMEWKHCLMMIRRWERRRHYWCGCNCSWVWIIKHYPKILIYIIYKRPIYVMNDYQQKKIVFGLWAKPSIIAHWNSERLWNSEQPCRTTHESRITSEWHIGEKSLPDMRVTACHSRVGGALKCPSIKDT